MSARSFKSVVYKLIQGSGVTAGQVNPEIFEEVVQIQAQASITWEAPAIPCPTIAEHTESVNEVIENPGAGEGSNPVIFLQDEHGEAVQTIAHFVDPANVNRSKLTASQSPFTTRVTGAPVVTSPVGLVPWMAPMRDGKVGILYRNGNPEGIFFRLATFTSGAVYSLGTEVQLEAPHSRVVSICRQGLVYFPSLGTGNGRLYALWQYAAGAGADTAEIRGAYSDDFGANWTPLPAVGSMFVSGFTFTRSAMIVPIGNALLAINQLLGTGSNHLLYGVVWRDGGSTWTALQGPFTATGAMNIQTMQAVGNLDPGATSGAAISVQRESDNHVVFIPVSVDGSNVITLGTVEDTTLNAVSPLILYCVAIVRTPDGRYHIPVGQRGTPVKGAVRSVGGAWSVYDQTVDPVKAQGPGCALYLGCEESIFVTTSFSAGDPRAVTWWGQAI